MGDGSVRTIPAAQLGASYRSCPAVVGTVVTKIRIKLQKSSQIAVRIAMDDALAVRPDFSGLRSGGSIFKNPPLPNKSAGIILDEAEVAVVPGEAFGTDGYLRLSYALGDEDLIEGVRRIQELLA